MDFNATIVSTSIEMQPKMNHVLIQRTNVKYTPAFAKYITMQMNDQCEELPKQVNTPSFALFFFWKIQNEREIGGN